MLNQKENPELVNLKPYIDNSDECAKAARKLEWGVALTTMLSRGIIRNKKILPGFAQYGVFFATMLVGREVTEAGKTISSGYFHLRHGDEIADGDLKTPKEYSSARDYLLRTREVIEQVISPNPQTPIWGNKHDILLVNTINQAKKRGIDLGQEYLAIWDTMIFDEDRRRTGRIPTQAELDTYWRNMDTGCVSGSLKIAGESVSASKLDDLSIATRTMFSIRDFVKDLKDGIVNISVEDVENYGVDMNWCKGKSEKELLNYRPMRLWFKDQTQLGMDHLSRSTEQMKELSLKRLTRAALKVNFIGPTERGLQRFQQQLAA